MRIAYLVSRYPLVSHAFILNEVRALRALGVEVEPFTVVRAERHEVIEPATREEDARTSALRPFGPSLVLAHLLAFTRPRAYVRALRRALGMGADGLRNTVWQLAYFAQAILLAHRLRRQGITHIHVHHANVAADVALLACEYNPALTWSLSLHGPTEFADVPGHRLPEKLADATWVACISDFARSQAMALTDVGEWDKLHVVHLGVDLERFGAVDRDDGGPLRILSVGRLATQKGQPVLLEAMRLLEIDAHLTLVGDGPLRAELEALAHGLPVTFTGAIGQDRLAEYYARADIFCLSSFAEGLPVVLMEAMACGLPCVAPRINGIPELVDEILVSPARPDQLAAALTELANDPDRRRRLGEAGRERVARDFEINASARALRELFAS